jgi:hypothetical protein
VNCGFRDYGVMMPRFSTEAAKQQWLAKCAATRAANRKAAEGDGSRGDRPVPGAIPDRDRPHARTRGGGPVPGDLDQAIDRAREDLAALERAKAILEREP